MLLKFGTQWNYTAQIQISKSILCNVCKHTAFQLSFNKVQQFKFQYWYLDTWLCYYIDHSCLSLFDDIWCWTMSLTVRKSVDIVNFQKIFSYHQYIALQVYVRRTKHACWDTMGIIMERPPLVYNKVIISNQ